MNDRFKFRLWWKDGNRYYNDDDRILHIHRSASYQEVLRMCLDDCGIIIEQCTGLKDKNGTLIYEGDIVKCDAHEERHHANYWHDKKQVVVFTGCAFRLRESYLNINEFSDNRIEIIGNIHETKGE